MIRNLKVIGLALVVIFATGSLTVSTASATDSLTTTGGKAWLTGTSHDSVFEVSGKKFTCTTSRYTATIANGSSQATVLAAHVGTLDEVQPHNHCSASTGNVTIAVNHCHYVLTGSTVGSDNGTDATFWIRCPTGEAIKITSSLGFTISVQSQTPTEGGVTYTDLPAHSGGSAVRITATGTGITSTCAPAFTCGLASIATHTNTSKFTGTVDITAFEDLGGTLTAPIEGKQIPVEWS